MAKNKNIKIQLNEMLNEKLAIGESRHEAKQTYAAKMNEAGEKFNVAQSEKIHSVKTAQNYREVINAFANWIRTERPEIWKTKDVGSISKTVAYDYLKGRDQAGLSAWSISRDMAGLNKVLGLGLTKAEGDLKERKLSDISRSRGDTNSKLSETVLNENKDQILLAKATGIRRESITKLEPRSFILDKEGTPVALKVKWEVCNNPRFEKGGRFRIAPVLQKFQLEIKRILDGKDPNKPIFNEYNKKIDNHAFRSEYAVKRYEELRDQKERNGKYVLRDFRGYDSEILKTVAKDLGHNRITVVVEHYLR